MDAIELKKVLEEHENWLRGCGGARADLCGANLYGANLREAGLCGANLSEADLRGADLRGADLFVADLFVADLYEANLYGADLRGANLRRADLRGADLREAGLSGANLYGANLRGARLENAKLDNTVAQLQCPEFGSFIGWKKMHDGNVAKLEIPEDAKRSSATTRKCRCDKAKVLAIYNKDGSEANDGCSKYDASFKYIVGETVSVDNFDDDRWNECSTGIHFFITRKEAEDYV